MINLDDIKDCPLDRKTPFGIRGVSCSQFSVARFYGMIKYNGETYIYNPVTDELIRSDVLKWAARREREDAKAAKQQQTSLPL